jgi:V8-like Glu-specific endopeptidase
MRGYIIFILLFFFSIVNFAQTPKNIYNSLGLITNNDEPIGSAFCVSPNKIITAAHNLFDKKNGKLIGLKTLRFTRLDSIRLIEFKILKLDTCFDYAVLEVKDGNILNFLTTGAFRSINKLDKIKYYGYDLKASEKYGTPHVTSYSSSVENLDIRIKNLCQVNRFKFRGRAYYGFSGGPILNSKDEVIGFIANGILSEGNTVIFGYPVPKF